MRKSIKRNGLFGFGSRESKELPTAKTASNIAAQESFIRDQLKRMRGDGKSRPSAFQVVNIIQNFRQQVLLDNETINSIIEEVWGVKRNPRKAQRNPEETITEVPNMHKYQSEQDKARLTAAFIGHKLGVFQPASATTMVAGCERCGNTVTISGKTMDGLAVISKCIR